ncbi:hypothetical protein ACFVFT_14785 [Streptomyces tendae]|uniref:hypothetical protein n=1 Tax=Streptomyces tendae TaxID=1932 RepID=UPI0036D10879
MTGPACGNNPNHKLTDGDRQAVDSFRAYLTARAALRDRIAAALHQDQTPPPVTPWADEAPLDREYFLHRANAVLAVLPATTNHDTGTGAELTAEEARGLVDDLGLQLYRAQDALAFVGECCAIAEREQRPITPADVREWLKGAQCGRQLAADAVRRVADETATTETQPFVPPVHYRRDDNVDCCVHTIPIGPNSCAACRELADAEAVAGAQPEACPPGCIACATDESHDPAPAAGARQDGAQR